MLKEDFFVFPFHGNKWKSIRREKYKDIGKGWKGVSRFVFTRGEKTVSYEVRYFEVKGGGYTTLEKHSHTHFVIGARGNGVVVVGKTLIKLKHFDILIIPPWVPHQFINLNKSPFGFFCIVDRERDRPKSLEKEEIEELMKNEEIRGIIKID